MGLVSELRRRNVFRMAVLYMAAAWLIMQVAEVLESLVGLPGWAGSAMLGLLTIGFPIALILSWFYEITPEGISLEKEVDPEDSITHVTGRRLDFIVISMLCAAVIMFAYDKWWIGGPPEQSIAVLPFNNMSSEPEQEYFSDGISEELLNLLAKIPQLKVISRTSAFSFKGKDVDVRTVAERLNVAHVLEGSVRKAGNQLRITAQLIDARSDTHLWSETYDRTLDDIFAIQDEIAAEVVEAIAGPLLGEAAEAADPRGNNADAYNAYLLGRHFSNRMSEEDLWRAIAYFEDALALDPDFGPAWVGLANAHQRLGSSGYVTVEVAHSKALGAVERALELDGKLAQGWAALGAIKAVFEWDWAGANAAYQRALELNPGSAEVVRGAGSLAANLGRLEEAIELTRRAVDLDPLAPYTRANLALMLTNARDLEEAATVLRKEMELNPDLVMTHSILGFVYLAQSRLREALEEMQREQDEVFQLQGLTLVHLALGEQEVADAAFAKLIENHQRDSAFQIAQVYAYGGNADQAFDWLERAYLQRDGGLSQMKVNLLLANLHDDPRWNPFLEKMGLAN